ncbi:MAG: 3'-5' exonuclease, partial [Acidobacteriota bacterium]
LRRAFRAVDLVWPKPKILDTADLLGRLDRQRRLVETQPTTTPTQLGQARAFLGLPPHDEHHALHDALATAELWLALRARLGMS